MGHLTKNEEKTPLLPTPIIRFERSCGTFGGGRNPLL